MYEEKVEITCVKNGPARINGNFKLIFPTGEEKTISGRLSICRCGMSEKMPLCDGAHKNCTPQHDDRVNKIIE